MNAFLNLKKFNTVRKSRFKGSTLNLNSIFVLKSNNQDQKTKHLNISVAQPGPLESPDRHRPLESRFGPAPTGPRMVPVQAS